MFIIAITQRNLLTLEILIQNGANPFAKDGRGWTPYHYAAFFNCPRCLSRLLECPSASATVEDNQGLTPLDIATWNNSVEAAAVLKGKGPARATGSQTSKYDDTCTEPKSKTLPSPVACKSIPKSSGTDGAPAKPARKAQAHTTKALPQPPAQRKDTNNSDNNNNNNSSNSDNDNDDSNSEAAKKSRQPPPARQKHRQ